VLHYETDPAAVLGAGLVSLAAMGAGALRGLRRAASLQPAMALAPAAPAAYGSSLCDRLALHGVPAMILRHLGRWPLRAALTTAGLSLAVALQISMLFSFDALDRMLLFHARTHDEDLTVLFARPLALAAEEQSRQWPGVRAAEGWRALPARLSSATASRVTSLAGLPASGTLRALLDADLQRIRAPRQGVALPAKLAALLGVGVGDIVAVQPIGSDRRFSLPVARIVEQYVGLDAYMDLEALNGLLGADPSIGALDLRVEPGRRAELLRSLKENRLLAGIVERSVVLASFRDTMLRTLTLIVSFFVAFAGVTAFGIAFSSARITLSEREREFAILASLGFTEAQLRGILAGEVAILVAAAVVPGCALGYGLSWVIVQRLDTELYRVPLAVSAQTLAIAVLVMVAAAIVSAWVVGRRLERMDVPALLNARL
jgi:putative ABC transport system permease protein